MEVLLKEGNQGLNVELQSLGQKGKASIKPYGKSVGSQLCWKSLPVTMVIKFSSKKPTELSVTQILISTFFSELSDK